MTRPAPWTQVLVLAVVVASSPRTARALPSLVTAGTLGGVEQLAPVATRRLPRGTVLRESDISVARAVIRGPVPATRAGWITRRVVQPGEVLGPPAVAPAPLLSAGQTVQYIMVRQGLRLSMPGRVTAAAELGDVVSVRLGANRRVQGIVTGTGQVSAPDLPRTS